MLLKYVDEEDEDATYVANHHQQVRVHTKTRLSGNNSNYQPGWIISSLSLCSFFPQIYSILFDFLFFFNCPFLHS